MPKSTSKYKVAFFAVNGEIFPLTHDVTCSKRVTINAIAQNDPARRSNNFCLIMLNYYFNTYRFRNEHDFDSSLKVH